MRNEAPTQTQWKTVRLGDICKTTSGGTPSRTNPGYYGGNIPWVKSGELRDGIVSEIEETITEEGLNNSSAKIFPKYTLLIALYGATVGRLGILSCDAATNQAVCAIFPPLDLETKYLFWFLRSIRRDLIDKGQGGAQPNISQGIVKDLQIPFPPQQIQQEVVAEIEKQFSRLDEAVTVLKRIQANLKRYKAAVLKAAVEGKLTEQWRKEHPDVEPADQLLKRILAERRAKWEAEELAKMKAKGMKPKDDSWKKKYKEPAGPNAADLPELPEGWAWARLDAIASLKGGITVDKKRQDSTARLLPYLRVANVQRGFLDLTELKQIEAPETVIEELCLQENDILFNEGGDRDKLGRGWIWEGQVSECIHQNHVFRARLFLQDVSAKLVSWWGNTFGKDYFLRQGKQTTNLASINLSKLSEFPVPLQSVAEALVIVEEIDRRLSVTEELEVTIDTSLKRAERLRQTILQKAFNWR